MNVLNNSNIEFNYAGNFISNDLWIHPDRTEQTFEIIYVSRGTVFMHDDIIGDIKATKGQVIVLEQGSRHYGTEYSDNVRFYWLHFKIKDNVLPFSKRYFRYFESVQLFRELLYLHNLPDSEECEVNAVLVHILSELYRLSKPARKFNRRAEEIFEWMRINANAQLKIGAAAEHFGISKDHITRILKNSYNCGFKALCDRFIMSQAKSFLCNTELYIKEISAQLKFPSDKAFIGFFKYHEGVFPMEFRNRFSKIHMNNK